jgi:co-chaperonin GroES (HSP10)
MDNKEVGYRPIGKRILAEQVYESRETKTGTGIILTVSEADVLELPTDRATVIRKGKEVGEEINIGDTLHFNGRKTNISFMDKKYIIVREEDVNGIVEA